MTNPSPKPELIKSLGRLMRAIAYLCEEYAFAKRLENSRNVRKQERSGHGY